MARYNSAYYKYRDEQTRHAAKTIVAEVIEQLDVTIHSAADVGCGVGTWLAVLHERGVEKIQAYEGPWLDADALVIPRDCLTTIDLEQTEIANPEDRFDLAICLEVAEHLSPQRAGTLVHSLCALSERVLFSAAIPGQGGIDHVNEQWPAYWAAMFRLQGFLPYDTIRPKIWNDEEIPFWYRQNTILYVHKDVAPTSRLSLSMTTPDPLPFVHPTLLAQNRARLNSNTRPTFKQRVAGVVARMQRRTKSK